MPLMKGHSAQVVSSNIKEMVRGGYKPKQAIAASLAKARKFKKMAEGGEAQSLEDGGMEDMPAPEMFQGGKDESMAEMDSKGPEDYTRGLNEIREDGEYYPDEVANPSQMAEAQGYAMALKRQVMEKKGPENYAMGGLVEADSAEDERLHGTQPEYINNDGTEEPMSMMPKKPDPMEHPKMGDPMGMGLSEEAKMALRMKKSARKYGAYNPKA